MQIAINFTFLGGEGSGSGTGDFPVSKGEAFLVFSLEPNDYVLIVKDLDVGVNDFYTESIHFTVKGEYQFYTDLKVILISSTSFSFFYRMPTISSS